MKSPVRGFLIDFNYQKWIVKSYNIFYLPKKVLFIGKGTSVQNRKTSSKIEKKSTEPGEKIPPVWEEVLLFFKEKNNSEIEAQKFYNHFQSNGWLVGGKSKMKDWKAAARNWMLNANKFQPKFNLPQPNHLQISNNKNYAEPL